VDHPIGGLHPLFERRHDEAAEIGAADQGAELFEVDEDGHVLRERRPGMTLVDGKFPAGGLYEGR
jgi:hypothetical protein